MPDPASPSVTLLYVEDEVLVQADVIASLEDAGFTLAVADNGERALQILAERGAELHGVITDINLGAGPDGWAIAKTARELISGIPVVYVSAASEHEWTSHGVRGSTMIAKPFACAQLVAAMSTLLVTSNP